jgi:hypothetical protein
MSRRLALALALCALACSENELSLVVDLRTDYVPQDEFAEVVVTLSRDGSRLRDVRESVARADDFSTGRRIVEIGGLTPGHYALELALVDAAGTPIADRTHAIELSGTRGLTVLIARDCTAGACAPPLTCHGGRCVDPSCDAENVSACGTAECASDPDCTGAAPCASPSCTLGACLFPAAPGACPAGSVCHPARGCIGAAPDAGPGVDSGPAPDSGGVDGGPRDGGTVSCVTEACDGRDNDCDMSVDEGFTCQAGGAEACTTTCGSAGMRTCDATCNFGPCIAADETCDDGCDDDLDLRVDEGCGALHDTCATAVEVGGGGTFHMSTCGATNTIDAVCGIAGTPDIFIHIAPPGGSFTFSMHTPGTVYEHINPGCAGTLACDTWTTAGDFLIGTAEIWLLLERSDGGCGPITFTVTAS